MGAKSMLKNQPPRTYRGGGKSAEGKRKRFSVEEDVVAFSGERKDGRPSGVNARCGCESEW